jgi:hypothetical protein
MAVDFLHRLIVTGPEKSVKVFARQMRRKVWHRPIGQVKAWREHIALSFEAMYKQCAALQRVYPVAPSDPYEMRAWRATRLGGAKVRIRYQFQTRNMEVMELFRLLSRCYPSVVFVLVTYCLDVSEITSYFLYRGHKSRFELSVDRRRAHWSRAVAESGIEDEAAYDDEDARSSAECHRPHRRHRAPSLRSASPYIVWARLAMAPIQDCGVDKRRQAIQTQDRKRASCRMKYRARKDGISPSMSMLRFTRRLGIGRASVYRVQSSPKVAPNSSLFMGAKSYRG